MSGGPHILVRADAGAQTGSGHVMRCLALAQACQDMDGGATFLTDPGSPGLEGRLVSEGIEVLRPAALPGSVEDARLTAQRAQKLGVPWVVLDGYQFGFDFQCAIKEAGLRLLVIDDYGHAGHYCADLVLNQNAHANEHLYASREPQTRLLLGTKYVLLRREFLKYRGWQRQIPEVARKVLVTLGGGDPENVTLKVVQVLRQVELDCLEAAVLVGAANPHQQELQALARSSPPGIRLCVNAADVAELMAWADLAVAAAGVIAWELAFMGLPSLHLILAENQREVAETLARLEVAENCGWGKSAEAGALARLLSQVIPDKDRRSQMSHRARLLVDGEGASRVVAELAEDGKGVANARP